MTARAVAALPILVEYAAPLLRSAGVLVAWKGAVGADELQQAKGAAAELGMALEEVRRVEPFEGARERHLVVFRKVAHTPGGYPRRPGMAAKRPLGRHPKAGQRRSGANKRGTAAQRDSDRPEP